MLSLEKLIFVEIHLAWKIKPALNNIDVINKPSLRSSCASSHFTFNHTPQQKRIKHLWDHENLENWTQLMHEKRKSLMNPDSSTFYSVLHEVDYRHCSRAQSCWLFCDPCCEKWRLRKSSFAVAKWTRKFNLMWNVTQMMKNLDCIKNNFRLEIASFMIEWFTISVHVNLNWWNWRLPILSS